jgi:REP element-mobilizing transposase RayT
MADKFQGKYRIPSARLQTHDYGSNGAYFITICTADRINYFGEIKNREMIHSPLGEIAHQCWIDIPKHFPFVKLDAHIIMPNHTHGIIIIDKSDLEIQSNKSLNSREVQTQNIASQQNKFGPQSQNLASIIRGFKTGVTVNARKINPAFGW